MGLLKSFNKRAKAETETGLGTNASINGGRFFNKDGTPNIEMRGIPLMERLNLYHTLLSLPKWKFLLIIIVSFITINLAFAGLYLFIGMEHLNGMVANTYAEKFGEAFFFSAQTFTTVGYGRINPVGFAASFVAALEALTGLLSFALITGLLYGRFARPKAYINYSKNALFVPFRDGVAFMMRMVPYTRNFLVNVEARLTMSMQVVEYGVTKNNFFQLDLDISKPFNHSVIKKLQLLKTAKMIEAAVVMGAILGKANDGQLQALRAFALDIGIAFQIIDDLLDYEGSQDITGKAVNKDANCGKITLHALLGVDAARSEAKSLIDNALEHLSIFGKKAERLRQLSHFIIERRA